MKFRYCKNGVRFLAMFNYKIHNSQHHTSDPPVTTFGFVSHLQFWSVYFLMDIIMLWIGKEGHMTCCLPVIEDMKSIPVTFGLFFIFKTYSSPWHPPKEEDKFNLSSYNNFK